MKWGHGMIWVVVMVGEDGLHWGHVYMCVRDTRTFAGVERFGSLEFCFVFLGVWDVGSIVSCSKSFGSTYSQNYRECRCIILYRSGSVLAVVGPILGFLFPY